MPSCQACSHHQITQNLTDSPGAAQNGQQSVVCMPHRPAFAQASREVLDYMARLVLQEFTNHHTYLNQPGQHEADCSVRSHQHNPYLAGCTLQTAPAPCCCPCQQHYATCPRLCAAALCKPANCASELQSPKQQRRVKQALCRVWSASLHRCQHVHRNVSICMQERPIAQPKGHHVQAITRTIGWDQHLAQPDGAAISLNACHVLSCHTCTPQTELYHMDDTTALHPCLHTTRYTCIQHTSYAKQLTRTALTTEDTVACPMLATVSADEQTCKVSRQQARSTCRQEQQRDGWLNTAP